MKRILLLVICLGLCGCATTITMSRLEFEKVLKDNPTLSPDEAHTKMKIPPVSDQSITPSVRYQTYSIGDPWNGYETVALFFKDNEWIVWGPDTPINELNTLYKLGAIDKDEYRWRYEQLEKQKEMAIQASSAYLQAMNQQRLINLQQQQSWQASQQIHFLNSQSSTDCHTDSFGNTHCNTQY